MSLQEKLNAMKEQGKTRIPEKLRAIMLQATEDLQQSGIVDGVIKKGATIPDFTLNNAKGEAVNLQSLLAKGPVVLSIYRGKW